MRTLLIDNHDSYTYNVFHLLAGVSGEEPIVVDNDAVSWRALERWDFDAIVLSPGPGTPRRWHDFCVCDDILRYSEIPVLGICLGHQGLGKMLDGEVSSAPEAMHGRLSRIFHEGSGLFEGIPQGFPVVRYHSLAITGMNADGNVCAWADDGVVMGIEHRRRPMWGVQFHPESVATAHGAKLVENFYAQARRRKEPPVRATKRPASAPRRAQASTQATKARTQGGAELRMRSIPGEPSTEALFERLFGDEEHAFWLDSADAPTRLARSSYLGTSAGAGRCVLEYDVDAGAIRVHRAATTAIERGSIFDVLDRELATRSIATPAGPVPDLIGGFVGYLGYELKADCGSPNVHSSDVPDAVLMLANRVVAVDHVRHRTHLLRDPRRRAMPRRSAGWTRPRRSSPTSSPTRRRRPPPTPPSARRALPTSASTAAAAASATSPTSPAARPSSPPASPTRCASPTRSAHRRARPSRFDLLPQPAAAAIRRRTPPSAARRASPWSAPRRSASSASTASARVEAAPDQGHRPRAPPTRPRTPPCAPSWPTTKRTAPST